MMLESWEPRYIRSLSPLAGKIANGSFRLQTIWTEIRATLSGQQTWAEFFSRRVQVVKLLHKLGLGPDADERSRLRFEAYSDQERHDGRMQIYLEGLARAYHANPYLGRATIVRARREPAGWGLDRLFGWTRLLRGQASLVAVAGDHTSMLQRPGVADIATALGAKHAAASENR